MPVLNGYQVLAQMQQDPELATIAVIILTSLDDTQENTQEEWARRLGVSQFLAKPIDPVTIIHAVAAQLAVAPSPPDQGQTGRN
jgi:CheY-like chemotaxis protein